MIDCTTSGPWMRCTRPASFIAGVALVVITIIIPYGVFTRYVLNSASSWPEPMAILLMIWLSFLSAVVCYREHLHIARRHAAERADGRAARAARRLHRGLHAGDQPVPALVRHQARARRPGTRRIAEFPAASRSASPICRCRSAARSRRCSSSSASSKATGSRRRRPRTTLAHGTISTRIGRAAESDRHGRTRSHRQLHRALPDRHAGRLRARPRRHRRPHSGWAFRWRPSRSRPPTAWTTSRCSRSRSSSSPAPSWAKAAWPSASSISPRCSSASSAAGWRWSTCSPRPCSAAISGSSVADTASIGSVMIPQMIKAGYPRLFAVNVTDLGLAAAAADPALAQHGDLLAGGRRHRLGRASLHRRHHSGPAARRCR